MISDLGVIIGSMMKNNCVSINSLKYNLRDDEKISRAYKNSKVVIYDPDKLKRVYNIFLGIGMYEDALCRGLTKDEELIDLKWIDFFCIMISAEGYTFNSTTFPISYTGSSHYPTMWNMLSNIRKDKSLVTNPLYRHIGNRDSLGYYECMGIPTPINVGCTFISDLIDKGEYSKIKDSLKRGSRCRKTEQSSAYGNNMFTMYF